VNGRGGMAGRPVFGWLFKSKTGLIGLSYRNSDIARPLMGHRCTRAFAALIALGLSQLALAQGNPPIPRPAGAANKPATLTGKERLGRKWMDEQRIDNCNVPVDKRGSKPRPSACPHAPTG